MFFKIVVNMFPHTAHVECVVLIFLEIECAELLTEKGRVGAAEAANEAITGIGTQFHTIPVDVTNAVNNATILN